jgi:hypothetical protein
MPRGARCRAVWLNGFGWRTRRIDAVAHLFCALPTCTAAVAPAVVERTELTTDDGTAAPPVDVLL